MFRLGLSKLALILALGATASAAGLEFKFLNGLNYYQILGVGDHATEDEIKSAYRAAMMKHHPDRGGNKATAQFVNEAYEILQDGKKRQAFDQWRSASREPPPKTEAELRSETLQNIIAEVSKMTQTELRKSPRTTKAQMAALARSIIIDHSRLLPGAQIEVRDLATLLNEFALAHDAGQARGYLEMLSLAIGTIEILRERALFPNLEEGRRANDTLRSLESRLAFDIENHRDSRKRMYFDSVYEFLTGQSILRRPPVRSCEAALRYKATEDLIFVAPSRIDIRL